MDIFDNNVNVGINRLDLPEIIIDILIKHTMKSKIIKITFRIYQMLT